MTQQDFPSPTRPATDDSLLPRPGERPLPLEKTAEALVDALFPPGKTLPAGNAGEIIAKLRAFCGDKKAARFAVGILLSLVELRSPMMSGKWFRSLTAEARQQQLRKLSRTLLVRALSAPLKMAYLVTSDVMKATDARYGVETPNQEESERWLQQITAPNDCEENLELEADVVVVGSGAGGAVTAYELARRGLAVLIIEEGKHYRRRDFDGSIYRLGPKLYRANGATVALGRSPIAIPIGKSVGGTTTINSGTCFRTPDGILANWRETGLREFSPEMMAPHFERVEQILEVCPADRTAVGPIYDALKKGVHKLGMNGLHVLPRNAPDCDGQGLCQFGCPTGAKRSTNVSYIPKALSAGASLFVEFRADRLLVEGTRVTGITARGKTRDGREVQISVKAARVVLSMGSLMTPLFLRRNGVDNKNVGRHLSIHPAGAVSGHFPGANFRNGMTIPQGIGINDLAEDGIMFEGGTPPLQAFGLARPGLGARYVETIENYQSNGIFGFMIRDESRGTVRRSPLPGLPFITYTMNPTDMARYIRATGVAVRILLRAGAEHVFIPGGHGSSLIRSEEQLDNLLRRPLKQKHFMVTAYHPLGTARIAADPTHGVCDDRHRVFGRQGLYVIDGASVPSSLGVNPQITIMSMATRAAGLLAEEALAN